MPIGRDTQISQLNSSSSFYDWFLKENDEIIAKLNLINTFTVEGTNGITAPIDTNGKASIGLSGKVDLGISFNGPAYFNNFAAIPNVAVKVPQINSTVGGFTFGTPVRVYWDIDTNTVKYEPAKGSDPDQAEVMGVVSQITSTHAYVTLLGKIDGDFKTVNRRGIGLTAGWIYFVDPGITGSITDVEPTATGHVSKPIIMGLTGDSGLVLQMRGNYLNPVTVSPGITGANTLIFQCDSNMGPTLEPGCFVSMYRMGTTTRRNHFTNRKDENGQSLPQIPNAKILNTSIISVSENTNAYLTPAVTTPTNFTFSPSNVPNAFYDRSNDAFLSSNDSAHIVGMLQKIESDGTFWYYTVLTQGFSSLLPKFYTTSEGPQIKNCVVYLNKTYDPSKLINVVFGPFNPDPNFQASVDPDERFTIANTKIGFVYGNNFYVDIENYSTAFDQTAGLNLRSTSSSKNAQNYLVNGNFAVWQRDSIGKNSAYTSTGNVAFADMWRRRDGITGSDGTKSYYIIRREFDEYQSEVEGNPQYYIDVKALGLSAAGISGTNGGYTASDHYTIGHVIPGAKTFDLNSLSIKFYAKASSAGFSTNVYFSRYSGNQLLDYKNMGTVNLTTSWKEFTLTDGISSLQNNGINIDLDNDYCEVGIDLIPAIESANIAGITLGQDVYFSFASFSATSGGTPLSIYDEYAKQLNYCQQFYYTTYEKNENIGSVTLTDQTTPVQNCQYIYVQPNKSCDLHRWPIKMRTTPTVSFYSPASGLIGRAYNKSASTSTALLDTIQTSGTIGYGGEYRNGKDASITGTSSPNGVNVCLSNGIVNYDEVYFHIVADADFTL